jgi:hypothetical protein
VAYKVLVDDEVIGTVRNGDTVELVVQAGDHRLRLRVAGKHSPEVAFSVAAGGAASFDCGPAGSTLNALYQAIFERNAYIKLRPAP